MIFHEMLLKVAESASVFYDQSYKNFSGNLLFLRSKYFL